MSHMVMDYLSGVETSNLMLLQTSAELKNTPLQAVDGEVGNIIEFYFDEVTWQVRYLLVGGGNWLKGREVLISPIAIGEFDRDTRNIFVELTHRQIANSPVLDGRHPISRHYEEAYFDYYNWPVYWEEDKRLERDSRLHSGSEIKCLSVQASDGKLGHVQDFLVDTQYWSVRYFEIRLDL